MKRAAVLSFSVLSLLVAACTTEKPAPPAEAPKTNGTAVAAKAVYAFDAKTIDGETIKLDRYAGKVLLVVNVASKCGFTPQYEGLEKLYEKHQAAGLEILAFPCDQFGNQEPGTESEIKTFCRTRYSVKFPLFSKIEVNGPNTTPLYTYLKNERPPAEVKWNFTKFLVGRDGKVVKRFEPDTTPEALEPEVVALLATK